MSLSFLLLALFWSVKQSHSQTVIPTVTLQNAAVPDTRMPIIGLGTATYGVNGGRSNISHPEYWNDSTAFDVALKWYSLNGTRYDSADDYYGVNGIALALLNVTNNWTTIPRNKFFITSKTGPPDPLGYNDSIAKWKTVVTMFNTSYVDLLLIHWPSVNDSSSWKSTDPHCNARNSEYSAKLCRQSTWKAYEYIFNELKGAKAIGVSNFEPNHINDILELNSLIPSVNQIEFHGYWHEWDLVEYCQSLNILVNSYAPLGTPDVEYGNWKTLLTKHPFAINIGNKYGKNAAQVWLRWQLQQSIVINPRSENITHQKQNMNILDFTLTEEDMLQLASVTPPNCSIGMYGIPNCKVCPDPRLAA